MNRYSRNEAAIAELNAEQYRVTQQNGTEYPGTGEFPTIRRTGEACAAASIPRPYASSPWNGWQPKATQNISIKWR